MQSKGDAIGCNDLANWSVRRLCDARSVSPVKAKTDKFAFSKNGFTRTRYVISQKLLKESRKQRALANKQAKIDRRVNAKIAADAKFYSDKSLGKFRRKLA